jgi:hypothetical protein
VAEPPGAVSFMRIAGMESASSIAKKNSELKWILALERCKIRPGQKKWHEPAKWIQKMGSATPHISPDDHTNKDFEIGSKSRAGQTRESVAGLNSDVSIFTSSSLPPHP